VKRSINCLRTNLKLIFYINLLISSLKILFILSIWLSLYNLHTLELNLLNVIILNNLLWIIFNVLSVEKDDDPQLVMAYRRCEYTRPGVGNYICLGATLSRPRLAEGRTFLCEYKQISIYNLSTNVYYEKLEEISDLKIFRNASASHWKRCGGPYLARGPLFAHPCTKL